MIRRASTAADWRELEGDAGLGPGEEEEREGIAGPGRAEPAPRGEEAGELVLDPAVSIELAPNLLARDTLAPAIWTSSMRSSKGGRTSVVTSPSRVIVPSSASRP